MSIYNNLVEFIEHVHNIKLLPHQKQMVEIMYHLRDEPIKPLDICKVDCPPMPSEKKGYGFKATKKEENPMASYASAQIIADTTEKDQRRWASDRAFSIYYELKVALKKQFGLLDDEAPQTPAEFAKRIIDGKYTIDKEYADKKTYSPSGYIRWRDPAMVEDKAGYDAAKKLLEAEFQSVQDKVKLGKSEDLLAVIDAFKTWKN